MKLHILGCSAAELPNANLSSYLIDGKLLLDAGTIGSTLNEVAQSKIKYVLITHAHLDHIKDIPFFADNISIRNRKQSVTIYSISHVIRALKQNLFNNVVWPDFTKIPTPGNPIIRYEEIQIEKTFRLDSYKITAYKVNHTVPAVAYLIEDRHGKRLLYMGDSGPTAKIWKSLNRKKIHGMIIEVSLPNRSRAMALKTGHLTPRLLELELDKMHHLPDSIFITHCKPAYQKSVQKELKNINSGNLEILKDGAVYEL